MGKPTNNGAEWSHGPTHGGSKSDFFPHVKAWKEWETYRIPKEMAGVEGSEQLSSRQMSKSQIEKFKSDNR
jgi:hypothetical protein